MLGRGDSIVVLESAGTDEHRSRKNRPGRGVDDDDTLLSL